MKHTTTSFALLSLLFLTSTAFSQMLPNPGFEEWKSSGKEPPFDWMEPSGWKSTNSVTEFISAGVTRSGTAHGGGFSCSIRTWNVFGSDVPGGLANGNPNLDFSTYSIVLESAGTPISSRPEKLNGYYQYFSTTEGDYGYAVIILKKYNSATHASEVVGMGAMQLEPASNFTLFTVPVEYEKEDQPDSIVIAFFSSDPDNAKAGGTLLVDDIFLTIDGAGVEESESRASNVQLYPNPTSGSVHIAMPNEVAKTRTIIFYDLMGREVQSREFSGVNATIDLGLPTGLYTYRIIDGGNKDFVGTILIGR